MRKTSSLILNLILAAICICGLVVVVNMTVKIIDLYIPDEPKYAETTEGCTYYMLKDIPGVLETYLGYEPQMEFTPKEGKKEADAIIYLAGNRYLTVPVKLYAPDMWGLEVHPSIRDNLFRQWRHYSYNCFSRNVEIEFRTERGLGIYYDMPVAQEFFTDLTGSDEQLTFTKDYISMNGKDYEMLERSDTRYIVTEDTIISARTLSQVIYDWEMTHSEDEPTCVGNIFGVEI